LAALLAGCEKERSVPATLRPGAVEGSTKTSLRVYYDDGTIPGVEGVNCGCSGSGGNCLGEVVITPGFRPALNNVFTAVFTANDPSIVTAFTNNKTMLLNYVSSAHVNGVVNGTHTARARGASPGVRYLIIRDSGARIVGVYPLK